MTQQTNDAESTAPQRDETTPDRGERWYQRLKNWLWGYDFFISYHWASGGTYAVNLAALLREKGYEVFLDRAEYAMGDDWKKIGEVALRNTQRLVLVATRQAVLESQPVEREVRLFTDRGRHIVPIFFGDTFAAEKQADPGKHLILDRLPDATLHIPDTIENLPIGPAPEVIEKLASAHGVMRRRKLRQTITLIAVSILTTFAIAAGVSAITATIAWRNEADARNKEAEANRKVSLELGNASWKNATTARDQDGHSIRATHSFIRASLAFAAANEDTKGQSADLAASVSSRPLIRTFPHGEGIVNVAVSRDSRWLATCTGHDNALWVWDLNAGSRLHRFSHSDRVDNATYGSKGDLLLVDGWNHIWIDSTKQLKIVREFSFRGSGAFSPDDSKLVLWHDPVVDEPFHLMAWETQALENGSPLWDVEIPHTVRGLQFSHDGKRIITWGNEVWLYDAKTGQGISAHHPANGAFFLSDGRRVVTWGSDGVLRVISADDLTVEKTVSLPGAIEHVSRGDTRDVLFAETESGVHQLDVSNGTSTTILEQPSGKNWITRFSSDGRHVILRGVTQAQVWGTQTQSLVLECCHDGDVTDATFCNEEQNMLTCSSDGTARLWDLSTHRLAAVRHPGGVLGAVFAGTRVVSWGRDKTVRFWGEQADAHSAFSFDGTTTGAAVSIDESKVITWSSDSVAPLVPTGDPHLPPSGWEDDEVPSDKTARVWNGTKGVEFATLPHESPVLTASFSGSGDRVFTCSRDAITVWSRQARYSSQASSQRRIDATLVRCKVSTDLTRAVAWDQAGELWLWHQDTGQMQSLGGARQKVYDATFDRMGTRLVTCHFGGAQLWDAASGQELEEYSHRDYRDGRSLAVYSALFSADGEKVLTFSSDRTARIWSVGDPLSPHRICAHERKPDEQPDFHYTGGVFDSTEKRLLTWSDDGTSRLWNVTSGETLRVFAAAVCRDLACVETEETTMLGAMFSKDSSRILTWDKSGTVALWDTELNTPILILRHKGAVVDATFNSAETKLVTCGTEGVAQLWDLETHESSREGDRILEWEIRSGTELTSSGDYRVLTYEEWMAKKAQYGANQRAQ